MKTKELPKYIELTGPIQIIGPPPDLPFGCRATSSCSRCMASTSSICQCGSTCGRCGRGDSPGEPEAGDFLFLYDGPKPNGIMLISDDYCNHKYYKIT